MGEARAENDKVAYIIAIELLKMFYAESVSSTTSLVKGFYQKVTRSLEIGVRFNLINE